MPARCGHSCLGAGRLHAALAAGLALLACLLVDFFACLVDEVDLWAPELWVVAADACMQAAAANMAMTTATSFFMNLPVEVDLGNLPIDRPKAPLQRRRFIRR